MEEPFADVAGGSCSLLPGEAAAGKSEHASEEGEVAEPFPDLAGGACLLACSFQERLSEHASVAGSACLLACSFFPGEPLAGAE